MIGTVEIKTRPLRLAYLVDPNNSSQIREAIRLCSSLWGGTYAPIIPVYKKLPRNWADKPFKRPPANSVTLGYLDAFDPDVIVQLSAELPQFVAAGPRKVIKASAIWEVLATPMPLAPKFGIGMFEILGKIFDEYFRYKPKYPVRVVLPRLPSKLSLFWASVLGEVPQELIPTLNAHFREELDIEDVMFVPDKLAEMMSGEVLFPRRIAEFGLKHTIRAALHDRAHIFFLDATKADDIVDFWNLRALGRYVIGVPKQFQTEPWLKTLVVDFLKAHRHPWPHDPKVYDHASMIRSRNSTMDEMEKFAKTLSIDHAPGDTSPDQFFSLQHWYPRIWDEWARNKDGALPDDLHTDDENSYEIGDVEGLSVRVKSALPTFAEELAYHDEPRCANDVSFHLYGSDQYFAGVLPAPAGEHLIRAVGGFASLEGDWRIGRSGLAHLVKHDFTESVPLPLAEEVMLAWLSDLGWSAELSAPGLLAKQIYRQLEGQLFRLQSDKLLGLLEHMNGGTVQRDGAAVDDATVRPELERDLPIGEVKIRLSSSGGGSYDYLLSKGVFRLGIRIQCPNCLRNSWYPLQAIGDNFTCPRCLRQFPAVGNLSSGTWAYKTTGPFSVPAYAEGAYGVLLTLAFFNERRLTMLKTTPLLSFTAEAPNRETLEADFALLWRESVYGQQMDGVIIGECKTYGEFKKKDFDRMQYLAKTFPGAILVFSTLRKSLTARETRAITRITKTGRKHWKADRPINPVLILTGTELLSWHGPPYCWAEPIRKKFDVHGMLRVCDATEQIYLGLPSWQAEWHDKWERKRMRWAAKIGRQSK